MERAALRSERGPRFFSALRLVYGRGPPSASGSGAAPADGALLAAWATPREAEALPPGSVAN